MLGRKLGSTHKTIGTFRTFSDRRRHLQTDLVSGAPEQDIQEGPARGTPTRNVCNAHDQRLTTGGTSTRPALRQAGFQVFIFSHTLQSSSAP